LPLSDEAPTPAPAPPPRAVRLWLWSLWLAVLVMVVVGGITRLTGSGLSMVEWQPLIGAIPPLDEASWQAVFARYQASPQFQQVNHWMQLADFKRIFFWEYVHRLIGRSIGLFVFVPWLYFLVRGRLTRALALSTLGAFALGGAQGLLGWYMVKSGLVDEPRVSHLRLAAHLTLAFALGQWLLWLALAAERGRAPRPAAGFVPGAPSPGQRAAAWGLVALIVLQSVFGAFMAGTRAGVLFSSFPDMNGTLSPAPFFVGALLDDLLHNPAAIHWTHRTLAWLVLGYGLGLLSWLRTTPGLGRAPGLLGAALLLQVVLGALTVIQAVPISLAVAHQATAYLLLSCAVAVCHALGGIDETDATTEARGGDGRLAGAR
jgi:cytochrome c oxidase assembly protein subunit 15